MQILKKIFLIALIIGVAFCLKTVLFPTEKVEIPNTVSQEETEKQEQTEQPTVQKPITKDYVSIYFIGQNNNKEEVYKVIKREYNSETDGTKLEHALNILLKGPSIKENSQGIYSEIPKGTKLRSISKNNGKLYIDLSEDFEQGGGTDSLYKRLYQLIKTVNKNTNEDVYLKIEGREADVIGGEGIMINQPLTSNSLDN
jgi:spore germination protein GerM